MDAEDSRHAEEEHATATFFLIGIQADKYRRPHRAHLSTKVTRSGTTPSLIPTSATSRKRYMRGGAEPHRAPLRQQARRAAPCFFRPPYSIDQEPDTDDQVRPLEITQDMGYITIGDKIDPNDWRRQSAPHRRTRLPQDVSAHLPPCAATISAAATSSCCTTAEAIAAKPCERCP